MKRFAHRFADRASAGAQLAQAIARRAWTPPVIVLGLPRGGVAVARPVARALEAPLDVMVVRKIGLPAEPELAIGAIAPGGVVVREPRFIDDSEQEGEETFERVARAQRVELERRERVYRAGLPPLDLKGKTVLLIDDGLATGSTMLAAIRAARRAGAATVVAAVPIASLEAAERIRRAADDLIVLETPETMAAIGQWYERFEQLEDAEVCRLLELERGACSGEPSGD
jgi:putative phosphoribosyl transferase